MSSAVALAVAALALLPPQAGCRRAPQGRGPLKELGAADIQAVRDSVRNPFVEVAPGLFTRTVFRAAEAPGLIVEVRDLEVAPRRAVKELSWPGAVVMEVRAGRVQLTSPPPPRQLALGSTLSLDQGQAVGLENPDDTPASIRLYVISGK